MTAQDAPMEEMIQLQPMNIATAATDLLWPDVPRRFPELEITLSDPGTGWFPY